MAGSLKSPIQLEWFNVTYKVVLTFVGLVALVVAGAAGTWYYFGVYAPEANATAAIARAEQRLDQALTLEGDERFVEILKSAETALDEGRVELAARRFEDSRLAAMRSENYSLQALRIGGAQGSSDRLVRFSRIEGDVRVKKAGEFSWNQADAKMSLQIGDQVKTSSSASAQLIYFDGTLTTIQPGSLLEIRRLYENPVTKVRHVEEKLSFGELLASTQKRNVEGSVHEVATEKTSARSEDVGEFRVRYDREKKTGTYDVFQGRIEIASPSKRESLVAGEGIRSSNGRLSDKRALPAVPRLIAPRDQRVFISEKPQDETITLSWEKVAGAARYHLVISDKALFTNLLYDAEREGTSAVLDGVSPNSYYWKVASISRSGEKGQFSPPRRFRVSSQKIRDTTDNEPPLLEITEFVSVGLMVIVNGRTEPGAGLWIDDEKIDVSDDGTFYAVVRLRKEGENDLRFVAQDTAGNEARIDKKAYVELF